MSFKLRSIFVALLCTCCLSAAFAAGPGSLQNGERPFLSENVKSLTGNAYDERFNDTVSIKGIPYDGYIYCCYKPGSNDRWATYDIRGWDKFITQVGISDGETGVSSKVTVEVDGNTITNFTVRSGEKAVLVEIPLTNCSTITLRSTNMIWFANPRVIKGASTPPNNNILGVTQPVINAPATFVVDPGDLEKLATSLRKRVDGKAELKDKIANGFMSVMTFNLIDIPSPSVAQNVAEDIATKLINADFQLVERGQLDKALKELKIQDSALIDQKTAQQLGQITGCNYILVGSVSDRGQFIVMNARILETATGKAVAAESVECRKIEIKR